MTTGVGGAWKALDIWIAWLGWVMIWGWPPWVETTI